MDIFNTIPEAPVAPTPVLSPGFKPLLNETILDVNQSAHQYMWTHYKKQLQIGIGVGVVFDVVGAIFIFAMMQSGQLSDPRVLFILILPFIVYGIFAGSITNKIRHQFYQQFALANGYAYELNGNVPNLNGALFNIGHNHSVLDTVSGQYQNRPLWLFDYSYVTGSGKSSQTHLATVFKIDFQKLLPPILLAGNAQYYGGLGPNFKNPEKLTLEGDYNKYFELYTEKEFEMEALQICTPDFMEKTKDQWHQFSIDCNNTSLYIYSAKWIETKVELQNMYSLAEYLITKLEPVLERMQSDLQAMEQEANK
jgi:hypothetical protein